MEGKLNASLIVPAWFAAGLLLAQAQAPSWAQAGRVSVVPDSLNFGLVAVGKTKEISLTLSNAGPTAVKGTAVMEGPFSVSSGSYSLKPGQCQPLKVRYKPSAPGTNTGSLALAGAIDLNVPVAGWARMPPAPPGKLGVVTPQDERQSDFIVRYNDDSTSYVLKPAMMDGQFRTICDRELALKTAAAQPRRELAVVVLLHYVNTDVENSVKAAWVKDLGKAGYKRVLFCQARNRMKVIGLPLLAAPEVSSL